MFFFFQLCLLCLSSSLLYVIVLARFMVSVHEMTASFLCPASRRACFAVFGRGQGGISPGSSPRRSPGSLPVTSLGSHAGGRKQDYFRNGDVSGGVSEWVCAGCGALCSEMCCAVCVYVCCLVLCDALGVLCFQMFLGHCVSCSSLWPVYPCLVNCCVLRCVDGVLFFCSSVSCSVWCAGCIVVLDVGLLYCLFLFFTVTYVACLPSCCVPRWCVARCVVVSFSVMLWACCVSRCCWVIVFPVLLCVCSLSCQLLCSKDVLLGVLLHCSCVSCSVCYVFRCCLVIVSHVLLCDICGLSAVVLVFV